MLEWIVWHWDNIENKNQKPMKSRNLILLILLMVSSSIFAQEKINNIELSIGNSKDFFENVYVKDLESHQRKTLKDGFYILENSSQKGKFEINF